MKLPDICTLKQWKTISKKELLDKGYPVYGANGIIGYYDRFNHDKPTLMIGCRGTCGQIHLSEGKAYINGNAMCLDNLSSDFDTNYHEAVAMVPGMGDDKKGKVLDCVQTGYTLNGKVIRHAKVVVGE